MTPSVLAVWTQWPSGIYRQPEADTVVRTDGTYDFSGALDLSWLVPVLRNGKGVNVCFTVRENCVPCARRPALRGGK